MRLPITRALIKKVVGDTYFQRGEHYYHQGKAFHLELSSDGEDLTARVSGSGHRCYEVDIGFFEGADPDTEIHGECSCPIGYNCKHVAAALLQALEEGFLSGTALKRIEASPQEQAGPFEHSFFKRWLDVHIERPMHQKKLYEGSPETLVYILELDTRYQMGEEVHIWAVQPAISRRLKAGGLGKAKGIRSLDYTSRYRHQLSKEDENIAAMLELLVVKDNYRSHYESFPVGLFDELGAKAIDQLLASGRCYFGDPKFNEPIGLGPEKQAKIFWRTSATGTQSVSLDIESDRVTALLTKPFWYFDREQNLMGPVELDMDMNQAMTLLQAPEIQPQYAEEARKELKQALNLEDSRLPIVFKQQNESNITPKPRLRLFQEALKSYQFGLPKVVDMPLCALDFMYGAIEVPWNTPENQNVQTLEGDTLLQIKRNIAYEDQILEQLAELGVISQNAKEACMAFQNPENSQSMLAFTRAVMAKQNAGWDLIIDDNWPFAFVEEIDAWYTEIDEAQAHWFSLELGIQIDGERINLLPIIVEILQKLPTEAIENIQKLEGSSEALKIITKLPDGRYIEIPGIRLKGIIQTLTELFDEEGLNRGKLLLPDMRAKQVAELERVFDGLPVYHVGGAKLRKIGRELQNFKGINATKVPKTLKAQLRPYQQEGVNWLQFLRKYQLAGVLADDMGLGKTIQTLAHILVEKARRRLQLPCLVIAPTSLMTNWQREAARFAPSLKVLTLHGPDRHLKFDTIAKFDLILTTYPLLTRDKDVLLQQDFSTLILDEAQNIKNPNAKSTQLVHKIKATHRLCLTGTPMENHLGELWSLFNFLLPGFLGDRKRFAQLFRNPIEKQGDGDRQAALAARVAPFMLRRTKDEVVKELPKKTEMIRTFQLETKQADLYETIRLSMQDKVIKAVRKKGLSQSKIVILDALLKMRQVCCDPRLVKLEAAKTVKRSGKLETLMELLPNLVEEGRKILLFSQFTSMLKLIEEEVKKHNISYVKLTGQTTNRSKPINSFQSGEVPLFLISLKAGGVGLNLTAADTVIHYDPWWNPAVEQQATDRAHRIGQDKPVFVYKLIGENTVEEKIQGMQAKKKALMTGLFGKPTGTKFDVSMDDLQVLFQPLAS